MNEDEPMQGSGGDKQGLRFQIRCGCSVHRPNPYTGVQHFTLSIVPLANLDNRVLSLAGAAYLPAFREGLRLADGEVARDGVFRNGCRRPSQQIARG
jgi:hypothetical protein